MRLSKGEYPVEKKDLNTSQLSVRERRKQKDREDILAAAAQLFAENGFDATSMQAVAQQAGFSVGKLYTFFEGKKAIYEALLQRLLESLLETMDESDDPSLPPMERLRRYMAATFEQANRNRNLIRVSIVERLTDKRAVEKDHREVYADRLIECLSEAVAQDLLPPIDTRMLALMIIGACDELVFELGTRDVENPFTPIPELIMDMMVSPLVHAHRRNDPEVQS